MSIYKQFATDNAKENEGVEVTMPENDDGSVPTFVLARMGKGNKKYNKKLDTLSKPYRRMIDTGTMPSETSEKLVMEAFVETVLLGWKNIQGPDGKEIPFNKENALKVMKDLPDLYTQLQSEASNAARFREEAMEDEAKN